MPRAGREGGDAAGGGRPALMKPAAKAVRPRPELRPCAGDPELSREAASQAARGARAHVAARACGAEMDTFE